MFGKFCFFYLAVYINKNTIDIDLEILGSIQEDQLLLSKVYPFPNPFSESTYFTMFISETPAVIIITVYSLNGSKVRVLEQVVDEDFISIHWDGKDDTGMRIANGAYFYHVKAETNSNKIFEDIYKLAKVE